MKNSLGFSSSPYFNFVKILSAYLFVGLVVLAIILLLAGYGTPNFDKEKLYIDNIRKVFLYTFGGFSVFFSVAFTLMYAFSQVFNRISNHYGWKLDTTPISFSQYWQNILVIVLASIVASYMMAVILYLL